jgi:hypothetical protein
VKLILAVLALSTILIGSGVAQKLVLVHGIGRMSCAHWLYSNIDKFDEGRAWLLGFWSGLNHLNETNHHKVGHHTDSEGIIAEVRKVCETRPSMTLGVATVTVYFEMANR